MLIRKAKYLMASDITLGKALSRGLMLHCPKCGEGKLFRAYLKPVESCGHCGEAFGHIAADDGPAWLTILVVGHIIGPGLVLTQMRGLLDPWTGAAVWLSIAFVLMVLILPRAKGLFIALLWQTKGPGSERVPLKEPRL